MRETILDRIKKDLQYLCSKEVEGRLSSTKGAKLTASFLESQLQNLGFQPGGKGSYYENVPVPAARLVGPVSLSIGKWNLLHRIEFGEMALYGGGTIEGELVVLNEHSNYEESQLVGKVVLVEGTTSEMDLKSTVQSAKESGVKAILLDGGEPRWFHKSVIGDYITADKNIPVIKIRSSLLPEVKLLERSIVKLNLPIVTSTLECQNVMGFLPGKHPDGETIALVTHYDFLGDDPEGFRFEGAGDNAAGVATMLEVGRKLSSLKSELKFNILIVFTTGEESNLWGEKHLAHHPPRFLNKTIYLDALGRTPYYSLNLLYEKNDKEFANIIVNQCDKKGVKTNSNETRKHLFDVVITGTSRIKFRPYHTPDDTWQLIHVEVLDEVATILFNSIMELEKFLV